MDPTNRLRIATRIHFVLLRHFDEAVEVGALLSGKAEGREALWVCEASGDPELADMAKQLMRANRAEASAAKRRAEAAARAPIAAPGRVPQETAWSRQTTGFALSRPLEMAHAEAVAGAASASSWFKPMSWLRRSASR